MRRPPHVVPAVAILLLAPAGPPTPVRARPRPSQRPAETAQRPEDPGGTEVEATVDEGSRVDAARYPPAEPTPAPVGGAG